VGAVSSVQHHNAWTIPGVVRLSETEEPNSLVRIYSNQASADDVTALLFEPFFRIERTLPSPFDARPQYKVALEDHFWRWLYLPVAHAADAVARLIGRIQQGRISIYLTYSFCTLLALLFFVR